jgi:FtsZ-interacting cell division protein ZipA
MTDLQASLIAIGSVIVVGVISYNKWQEWRAKKSVESAFSSLHEDVLMGHGGHRQEPVLTNLEEPVAQADDATMLDSAPAHAEAEGNDTDAQAASATVSEPDSLPQFIEAVIKPSPLDPGIDCIIPVLLDTPQRGEKLSALFQGLRLVGSKPVQLIGQSETGHWETVAHGGAYHELQIGVQLATRSGPLTELEYSELVTGLNQLADEISAQPELPDMQQVMAEARRLHQLVIEFDAQLSVNIQAKSAPWMVSTLRPALQRQGLELRPDGRLVMPDGDGGMLFSLLKNANPADDTSKLMTLLLPVPIVAPDRNGFAAMTSFAKALATRLSGVVVDDSGQPLSEQAMAEIAEQVQSFYAAMEQAGIVAGSVRAQRLFN